MSRLEVRILLTLAGAVAAAAAGSTAAEGRVGVGIALAAGGVGALVGGAWTLRSLRRARAGLAGWARDLETGTRARTLPREIADWKLSLTPVADEVRRRLDASALALERLDALLDAMEDGVLLVGRGGLVRLTNARARGLLGCPTDPQGRPLVEAVRHAGVLATLERAARQSEPVVEEMDLDGGGRRHVRIHARAVRGGDPAGGIVAVFRDVTEARRVEAMRRDFVANASHELKTPLAAIRGFAERLAGAAFDDPGDRRAANTILNHAERLAALVDDLLELSRIESAAGGGRPEVLDVGDWVRRWLRSFEPRFAKAGLDGRITVSGDTRGTLERAVLERVVTNLVDNAIRYTEPGGVVSVSVEGDDPRVLLIRVRDSGIGIPAKALPRIFERFYRVDPARSRASGGTGLGLSIVRNLVEGLGGDVAVESRVGEGSAFTVTLPRLRDVVGEPGPG